VARKFTIIFRLFCLIFIQAQHSSMTANNNVYHNIKPKISPYFLILATIFLIEGFVVKSVIFVGNDPVFWHYVISSVITLAIIIPYLRHLRRDVIFSVQSLLIVFVVVWCFISSWISGDVNNIFYVVSFFIFLVSCFIVIPAVYSFSERGFQWSIFVLAGIFSLVSIILYIFSPGVAIDSESGRFQGAYISVANASGITPVLAVVATSKLHFKKGWRKIFCLAIIILSLTILYMTKTRSAIFETILIMTIVGIGVRINSANYKRGWLTPLLSFLIVAGGANTLIFGGLDLSQTASDFRLGSASLEDSRTVHWDFGIEVIKEKPLFGEGMLAKQTRGGTQAINLDESNNYDSRFDPHSLILSFGVQAGIPFAIGMILLITSCLFVFLKRFGFKTSLLCPEFCYSIVHLPMLVFSGGDLTSFGNLVDRIVWIFLGTLLLSARAGRIYGLTERDVRALAR
jgi:O-Antigen ligase